MYSSGERRRRFSDGGEAEKIKRSTDKKHLFDDAACRVIERKIDEVCKIAREGGYKKCTVDQTKLRDKYFFGAYGVVHEKVGHQQRNGTVQARGGKRGQGEAAGGAAAEPREGHHRALQIPAQDRVRGQSAQNCQRQDQEGRTQEQGAEGLSMEACSPPILHSSFPVQQSHNYTFDLFYKNYRTFNLKS